MAIVNRALCLSDLPTPSKGKIGWPWTEQSQPSGDRMPDGSDWPKISVVTPSYNQGELIEETIRSILLQGYPNLELIIIDGGSTDETLDVIRKYESFIAYWISEADKGQAHALNKGLHRAEGDLIGWQNSDDYYYPNAFINAALAAMSHPDYQIFYGSRNFLNLHGYGGSNKDTHMSYFDLNQMIPNANMANQSMFFRRKVFEEGYYINQSFNHCMDHEFFWRLIASGYRFIFIPDIKGCYRLHLNCKGSQNDNFWLKDTVKICESVYKNRNFPSSVRRKAWLFLRGTCLDHYGKMDLDMFQERFTEIIELNKLAMLDIGLLVRFCISKLGENKLSKLRNAKQFIQARAQ